MDLDRLKKSLEGFIAWVTKKTDYLAFYPCTVLPPDKSKTLEEVDGFLNLKPDSSNLPLLVGVPLRMPNASVRLRVRPGSRVLLGFEEGDPARPYAYIFQSGMSEILDQTLATDEQYKYPGSSTPLVRHDSLWKLSVSHRGNKFSGGEAVFNLSSVGSSTVGANLRRTFENSGTGVPKGGNLEHVASALGAGESSGDGAHMSYNLTHTAGVATGGYWSLTSSTLGNVAAGSYVSYNLSNVGNPARGAYFKWTSSCSGTGAFWDIYLSAGDAGANFTLNAGGPQLGVGGLITLKSRTNHVKLEPATGYKVLVRGGGMKVARDAAEVYMSAALFLYLQTLAVSLARPGPTVGMMIGNVLGNSTDLEVSA